MYLDTLLRSHEERLRKRGTTPDSDKTFREAMKALGEPLQPHHGEL